MFYAAASSSVFTFRNHRFLLVCCRSIPPNNKDRSSWLSTTLPCASPDSIQLKRPLSNFFEQTQRPRPTPKSSGDFAAHCKTRTGVHLKAHTIIAARPSHKCRPTLEQLDYVNNRVCYRSLARNGGRYYRRLEIRVKTLGVVLFEKNSEPPPNSVEEGAFRPSDC